MAASPHGSRGGRAHIAMVGCGLAGHTRPHVPLLTELVARGHRVTCAVVPSLDAIVDGTGAGMLAIPAVPFVAPSGRPGRPDGVDGLHHALEEAIVTLPVLLAALADDPPAVVIHDSAALAGPVLAACLGVPAVQLAVHVVAWNGFEGDLGRVAATSELPEYRRYRDRFARWLESVGARLPDHDAVLERPERLVERPERGLTTIPRAIQPHADRVDASRSFTPALDGARAAAGGWEPPPEAAARPVLLVAFGTARVQRTRILRAVVEAFADGAWHVVLVTGRYVDPAALGPVPANVELHETVAQLAVLAHADCFVTHAGGGSVTEALFHAVPMVAVPLMGDQFQIADRLAELGVGILLPEPALDAGVLRRAVDRLRTDPAVAARLADLRRDLHATNGAARAADLVEAAI